MSEPTAQRRWRSSRRIDLLAQLGPLRRGGGDPTWHTAEDGAIWRTTLTPGGSGLERLSVDVGAGEVVQQAWGPGASWLTERLPELLGDADDPGDFQAPQVLARTAANYAGWRAGRTNRVLEALIPAILEQKVTGKEAWLGWRTLVRQFGEPSPAADVAPAGLWVFPAPQVWRQIPSWSWHQASVDSKRSGAVLRAVDHAGGLESLTAATTSEANLRLRSIDGIGIWTTAETVQRALGDADAVSYRDYHLAKEIVYAFTGEREGTDRQLAELLLPFAGHRYRIQRLVELSGHSRPRRGPRMTVADMRSF